MESDKLYRVKKEDLPKLEYKEEEKDETDLFLSKYKE